MVDLVMLLGFSFFVMLTLGFCVCAYLLRRILETLQEIEKQ